MKIIHIFVLLIIIQLSVAKVDKYVRISLDAKWKNTPLVLEARYANLIY